MSQFLIDSGQWGTLIELGEKRVPELNAFTYGTRGIYDEGSQILHLNNFNDQNQDDTPRVKLPVEATVDYIPGEVVAAHFKLALPATSLRVADNSWLFKAKGEIKRIDVCGTPDFTALTFLDAEGNEVLVPKMNERSAKIAANGLVIAVRVKLKNKVSSGALAPVSPRVAA